MTGAVLRSLTLSSLDASEVTTIRAVSALAHTSEVLHPVKLVLAHDAEQASLRIETIAGLGEAPAGCADASRLGYRLRRSMARHGPGRPVASMDCAFEAILGALTEALEAAEWRVTTSIEHAADGSTLLRAAPPWAPACLVTVSRAAPRFVRVALGADVVREEYAGARTAMGLFALQASARLALARPALHTSTTGNGNAARAGTTSGAVAKHTIGWDAVVAAAPTTPIERTVEAIAHAAAACSVAREATLDAFRVLARSREVADAYLASDSRFESFRSIGAGTTPPATEALRPKEENDACRPQPPL